MIRVTYLLNHLCGSDHRASESSTAAAAICRRPNMFENLPQLPSTCNGCGRLGVSLFLILVDLFGFVGIFGFYSCHNSSV